MFNGIIFYEGKIYKIIKRKKGINLFVKSNLPLKSKDLGISISCDGVCLTLITVKNKILEVPKYPKYKSLKIMIDNVTSKDIAVGNNIAARNTETITVSKLWYSCRAILPPKPNANRRIAVGRTGILVLVT